MFRLIVLSCVVAAAVAQNVDPKNAKILKEQRFNAGDGRTGSAFATEDGVIFKEESDNEGNRVGQYSYIGADGKTYTVKYSAGKDGFRILGGDHIPSGGQGAAPFGAEEFEEEQVQLRQPSAPIPIPQQEQRVAAPQPQQIFVEEDSSSDADFNPFINPNDPTHLDFRFNKNAAKFAPNSPLAQQASLVPPCADCAGVNPFVNPFDASHRSGGQQAGLLAGLGAGVPAPRRPQPIQPRPQVQSQFEPLPLSAVPITTTTPSPRNFFPPGQLSLNRFETGFNFDFQS